MKEVRKKLSEMMFGNEHNTPMISQTADVLRPDLEKPCHLSGLWTNYRNHKIIIRATKVKIFNSNVMAVLLCVFEPWLISTQRMMHRLQMFINKC